MKKLNETELRQNLIINKSSDIVDNLEKIRDNQYSLYEVLKDVNRTIKTLSEEARKLNDTSKLTQYYTETTAKAAEAPKIVYAYTRELEKSYKTRYITLGFLKWSLFLYPSPFSISLTKSSKTNNDKLHTLEIMFS